MPNLPGTKELILVDVEVAARVFIYAELIVPFSTLLKETIPVMSVFAYAELLKAGAHFTQDDEEGLVAFKNYLAATLIQIFPTAIDLELYLGLVVRAEKANLLAEQADLWNAVLCLRHEFRVATLKPEYYEKLLDSRALVVRPD